MRLNYDVVGRKKIAKNSPFGHRRTNLSGYIFATDARIDNREKPVKQQYLFHVSTRYGELRPTIGWDLLARLGHPCKFQRVSRLGSVTARHSSSERQPNFAALNTGRHLYSKGRPSRWALAHILVFKCHRSSLQTATNWHRHVQHWSTSSPFPMSMMAPWFDDDDDDDDDDFDGYDSLACAPTL